MSDAPEKDQKIFDPSPRRLRKAREEGNVFRSKEVISVGVLIVGGSVLVMGMQGAFEALQTLAADVFRQSARVDVTLTSTPALLTEVTWPVLLAIGPFFGALFAAGFALNAVQSGVSFSAKPLAPKGNRISPLQGFKRMFSVRSLFESGKALVKVAVVGPVAYMNIAQRMPDVLMLHTQSLEGIVLSVGNWIAVLLAQVLGLLLLLAGVDFVWEKWRHKQDLKMTFQEVKQETKDSDGDPHVKGKRRQVALQNLRRPRLDHAVLKADVVVTNPTHYAVALRYDPSEAAAPRVLVKGIRKRALHIKALAAEHHIPTIENRPLARALYASVEEMQEIPEDLYAAVAAILAEVYRMKGKRAG